MTTAIVLAQTGLVIERGNPEFENTCTRMAEEYQAAIAELHRLMAEVNNQCDRLFAAFKSELEAESPGGHTYNPFDLMLYHNGTRYGLSGLDRIVEHFKRKAWGLLVDRIGVKKVMSVKKRAEFDNQLESGDLPDITPANVIALILGLADQIADFATDAAKEVFEILRPTRRDYKTNSAFRIGRRVILEWMVEPRWGGGGFYVTYGRPESELIAIDGVFHLLDGKGVMPDRRGPLIQAISDSPDGRGETEYFRFKCFKNRNLHLEFKRLDLVKQLNGLGAGEFVLGDDPE